ncbi:MAG: tripartite tricarboxylate transporter substrate-binding protein [Burkholderiales bacterium]
MLKTVLSLLSALCLALPASAQEAYPSRVVKFVVPFPPGGPLDVPARFIAQKLGQHWGRPVVVENQSGASGSIGANAVARAEPDGHTLLVTVDIPITMFPAVAKQLPYDPQAGFRPIGLYTRFQNGLFVNPAVPAATTAELVQLARKQPGKLTFSSAGVATPAHFAGELFKVSAGVDLTHVPYKGAAPAMAAALAGEVDMMFGPTTQGAPHARSGKLRALGVTGPRPSAVLPGVQPFKDQGFTGLVLENWFGVFAPAQTPDAVAAAIGAGWKQVMGDPEVREKMIAMDLEPVWEGPDALRRAVAADLTRWRDLARRAGITSPN